MNRVSIQYFQTPLGEMILGAYDNRLCMADWRYRKGRETVDRRVQKGLHASFVEEESGVLDLAKEELEAYFKGLRKTFDIPLLMVGTAFQKSVWKGLLQIPFGTTVSYKELAANIDQKTAVRAVASAVGANAISIFIPCHRIVGADGTLTGYAGGLEAKKKLLALEQNIFTI
ncbi:methylated-DNA--[protein]-cysteine S-methyltransferase [Sulfurovum sp. XGS-02]|uniref:methylated-DNA--[protein]-cysteine S-methyltransferase n=1 Tax=Sulfurovum sp. XGS-02 TaxID=2925411 RepID=UPI00204A39D8|nr:methylated-DNA--[protein]-cysteine S-methyltransferase [Sulfurovum sp. XGS-02]UPT78197.1 methylated-DNA--[protein]-cysteine S-methyltransferase [Sulfurovum sp. XGS-02]